MVSAIILLLALLIAALVISVFIVALLELNRIDHISEQDLGINEASAAPPLGR